MFGEKNVGRKHGPVPFRGARGTVPFSRRERRFLCDVLSAAKIGTVPCGRLRTGVSVPAWMGTGPFFGRKSCLAKKTSADNMDLSPFAAQGGQSHFRGENVDLFVMSFPPRKLGQSPVKGYATVKRFLPRRAWQ